MQDSGLVIYSYEKSTKTSSRLVKFRVAQQRLIDQKRAYEKSLGSFPRGFVMKLVGYPKINLDDYKIVINESTENAFKTGRDAPIQLRRSAPAPQ